ncbi:HAMP domain-containing sensor histidine kinase [Nocardia stercoris]|uniref:histidine kinase n=1 Tax=Nocardia stercoris TaxID=2483361 RepID=A0A3M2LD60_9NOCA|nr:HAMP domain-containing sensor histidine kinase [Nocardia stercoris]RMI35036.1 sensor histidine kinase [Nocardia stercoris]
MRTMSLRRRVTVTAVAIAGALLVVVALAVHILFGFVVHRGENAVLTDHMQLARQLALDNTPATTLVQRMDKGSVRARLVLADGRTLGSLDPAAGSQDPSRTARLTGPGELNRANLTLEIDTPLLARAQRALTRVSAAATVSALLLLGLALWFGVGRALIPLDTMTRLARDIARGDRGRRLAPSRTDTELGRAAGAFDEMLDALEGAEARARASERRVREFVGDAAHELRTPIAGIRAIAEAVVHQPPDSDPAERERMHVLLVREAQRAGRLVEDLLDLARIDSGLALHREPVDLHAVAGTQLDRVRLLYPGIEFHLSGFPVWVPADPEHLGRVLVNLLSNACQAMPEGGSLTVEVATVEGSARVTVIDTGPGVPEADRERIFDRLVRLDDSRSAGGSGLGLSIARGIAEAHGGSLRCVPPPSGSGARFVLQLPVDTPAETVVAPGVPAGPGTDHPTVPIG